LISYKICEFTDQYNLNSNDHRKKDQRFNEHFSLRISLRKYC
jgi:hypothetical protein